MSRSLVPIACYIRRLKRDVFCKKYYAQWQLISILYDIQIKKLKEYECQFKYTHTITYEEPSAMGLNFSSSAIDAFLRQSYRHTIFCCYRK